MIRKIALITFLVIFTSILFNGYTEAKTFSVRKTLIKPVSKYDDYQDMHIEGINNLIEVKNLKTTNPNVCVPSWDGSSFERTSIHVEKKGVGNAVISGDFYFGEKYLESFSTNVSLYKYKNPFKSIKLGKKELKKKFKKKFNAFIKSKKSVKKMFSIKLKKGWKIYDMSYLRDSSDSFVNAKNNSKIKIRKKEYQEINIVLKNTKKKSYEQYNIEINSN